MTHVLTLLPAMVGFGSLCLSMDRHQEDLLGRELPARLRYLLRVLGWVMLALSYFAAVRGFGWTLGSVAWTGHLSLAAAIVVIGLIVHDRRAVS